MLARLTLWLAAKIMRRRRYVPLCPVAKALASWAGKTIGAKGRATSTHRRRWAQVVAWADADEAKRDEAYALWRAAQNPIAIAPESLLDDVRASRAMIDAMRLLGFPVASHEPVPVPEPSHADAMQYAMLVDRHRNVANPWLLVQ